MRQLSSQEKHHEVVIQKLVKEKSQPMAQDNISVVPDVRYSGKKEEILLSEFHHVCGVLKEAWSKFVK